MRNLGSLFVIAAAAAPLAAQIQPFHLLIATRTAASPATTLLEADPVSGAFRPLGRFPSDDLPPLAVEVDPITLDAIVALDTGRGTRIVRLELRGLTVVREHVLATDPLPATDVQVAGDGDVYATFGTPAGGLYRIPRNGGSPELVVPLPHAAGIAGHFHGAHRISVVQAGTAGPPAVDPQIADVDLDAGTLRLVRYTGHRPFGIAGVGAIATALRHHVLVHDDGTIAISTELSSPRPIPVTPRLPPGSTVAVASFDVGVFVLGGAADPFVKSTAVFGLAPTWSNLVGPLPGDPVDLEIRATGAHVARFGEACGLAPPMTLSFRGFPSIGNRLFEARLVGLPRKLTLFALGVSNRSFNGIPLPYALPRCELLVSPDIVVAHTSDDDGQAFQLLPIPNDPALDGTVVYGQWLQESIQPFTVSEGFAVQVGR